jgi:hypothetical protein
MKYPTPSFLPFFRKNILFFAGFFVLLMVFGVFAANIAYVSAENAKNQPIFFFLRDLRQGDTGEDVLQLQKILKIAETGVFDAKTTQSVVEFQNTYANEVLRPAALTRGTGFVGLWTRLKLNQILLKPDPNTSPTAPVIAPVSSVASTSPEKKVSEYLLITFASMYSAPAGTTVTLSGFGFSTKSNTVHIGKKYRVENVAAKSDSEIVFTIPKNVSAGLYDISISNTSFKKPSNGMPFVVTVANAQIPVIEKIEVVGGAVGAAGAKKMLSLAALSNVLFPKVPTITFGQTIKITGKNFTPKDNMIVSNIGTFTGLSSNDGKTLTVTIPLPEYLVSDNADVKKAWFAGKDNLNWIARFVVVNTKGISAHTESAKCIINM